MKPKYEISVWEDVLSEDGKSFEERKIIVIGSDTMTSEARAREPKLVTNINGTNKFTFNMYYSYIDTRTGERVKNPYIQYLVNERKIKIFWKNEWYDLLIKQIKEDQVQHVFSYTCEDVYITELSRTGFELTFATELENNIGTAKELVEKVIENTDWRFDNEGSDAIYQETEEPVYEVEILNNISAIRDPDGEVVTLIADMPALVYYSCAPDINNLKSTIQLYYSGSSEWQQDENDMLVINGTSYTLNDLTWEITDTIALARRDTLDAFRINLATGLSTRYRAKRYVQSQKTVYNNIVDRYVNVYNNGELLGYNTTEFNDALSVINLFANPSNFSNVSGWKGEGLYFKLSPGFDSTTQVSSYTATSFLWLAQGYTFNTGIQNNRPYIPNGFIKGDKYILRLKVRQDGEEPADQPYIVNHALIVPSIQSRDINYNPTGIQYFNITGTPSTVDNWLEYDMECIKSCPYERILSTSELFGLFLKTNVTCWLEEAQFYKEVWGEDGQGNLVRIDPNQLSYQSIAQTYWKYFLVDQPEGTDKDNLVYEHISLNEWAQAAPVYNNFERYGTIEADNSNRFNILQTIAETFECWVRFKIEHDDKGYIKYDDDNLPCKWIQLKQETGKQTGIGFIYGIDLKGVVRNLKSDKISTKTIVEQNENEFGKNGFCSIARSEQNYPRENFIYNFDYYIQQGLLDKQALYDDLYNITGYYSQLHTLNVEYANNLELLTNKKLELNKQNAMSTIYSQYLSATEDEIASVLESMMKLAGATNEYDAYDYAESHYNDTKVQSLVNDRALLEDQWQVYRRLQEDLQLSLNKLETYISNLNDRQNEIINNLTQLNKQFYVKYSRFIQEGTWTSEDYWNDDLYYLDAIQVAYQSSRPQISYEINVLRLSDIDEFSSKIFNLGDISFVQDVEYFGYKEDKITPYKEQVVLTEITSYFDTPDKDTIKVQNYKNQFDDLFQRITATVQNLEFTQGKYAKAANIVASDGTIRSSVIQNTFNENKDLVYGAQNESATIDNTGITVTDNADASRQVKVTSGGVFVTNDGGNTWKNAIRGDGISTDLLTAGRINTEQITVYNGSSPSFRWDPSGLNAYKFTDDGKVDTTQFVRFDQYGIYGRKNAPEVWNPTTEEEIYTHSQFGLTWSKFFMKSSSGDKSLEISTDKDIVITAKNSENIPINRVMIGRVDGTIRDSYGIRIRDNMNRIVFESGNLWDEITQSYVEKANIAGWKFTHDCLESAVTGINEQSIRIYADGNIGCYGREETEYIESVYTIGVNSSFVGRGLNTTNRTFNSGETIFIFVSSIGKTKTQRQVNGDYNSLYDNPTYDASTTEYIPVPPSMIQISFNNRNYEIDNINWTVNLHEATHVTQTIIEPTLHTDAQKLTTYTYTFDLVAKINNQTIFSIPYTIEFNTTKKRYVPASDTKWCIDNNGDAIFHEIMADGGTIAGWFIDNEKIYQTTNGKKDGPIKTQLNSSGAAQKEGFDYTIITDAINAAMASIGGVLMQGGLINGYSIAAVAAQAANAASLAQSAYSRANDAYNIANSCSRIGHTHSFNYSGNTGYSGDPSHYHYYEGGGTTGGGN